MSKVSFEAKLPDNTPLIGRLMNYKWWYFGFSSLIIIPSLISLALFGLKPAIDFTGGTLLEISLADDLEAAESIIWEAAGEDIALGSVQQTGESSFLIRSQPMSAEENEAFKERIYELARGEIVEVEDEQISELDEADEVNETEETRDDERLNGTDNDQEGLSENDDQVFDQEELVAGSIEELRFETVGPTLGRELIRKTIFAIILAAGSILVYVAFRFSEWKYGVCAILALMHDTVIVLGVFSLLGYFYGVEVDTLFVTAVLIALAFSIHDTIVLYDRIRETLASKTKLSFVQVVNKSVAETLSRSVNNSVTTVFMLLALVLLGGETIRWFVFALLVSIISGTYSSPFVAAPLLLVWETMRHRRLGAKVK